MVALALGVPLDPVAAIPAAGRADREAGTNAAAAVAECRDVQGILADRAITHGTGFFLRRRGRCTGWDGWRGRIARGSGWEGSEHVGQVRGWPGGSGSSKDAQQHSHSAPLRIRSAISPMRPHNRIAPRRPGATEGRRGSQISEPTLAGHARLTRLRQSRTGRSSTGKRGVAAPLSGRRHDPAATPQASAASQSPRDLPQQQPKGCREGGDQQQAEPNRERHFAFPVITSPYRGLFTSAAIIGTEDGRVSAVILPSSPPIMLPSTSSLTPSRSMVSGIRPLSIRTALTIIACLTA